ncbi:MAG TPA: plastocyanin/azurin family copper-binding protein [Chloroflexota bacterium]
MQGTQLGGRRRLALGAVLGLTLGYASGFASPVWADAEVQIVEGSATDVGTWGFNPPEVTIEAGQTVTFRNNGAQSHTATAANSSFDTGVIGPGEAKAIALAAAAAYPFVCSLHPSMKGTIVVTAAAAAPAAQPAAPTPAAAAPAAVAKPAAQPVPTPTPFRLVTSPAATSTAPRAGSLPMELALPLLLGGGAAAGLGAYVLRRRR